MQLMFQKPITKNNKNINTMDNKLEQDLAKVAAATTLCHLCTLKELEAFVKEAKKKHSKK